MRRTFQNHRQDEGLIPSSKTTATEIKLVYLPNLEKYFGDSSKQIGSFFFAAFNKKGAIEELPKSAFDTSYIKTAPYAFFSSFNEKGKITKLPPGSFDTSQIIVAFDYFFSSFNENGKIQHLPKDSFDLTKIS